MTGFGQLELDRWGPALRWTLARLSYRVFPRLTASSLESASSELGGPRIPQVFSRDLRELPPALNDGLLELFGRSEQTLSNHFTFHGISEKFGEEIDWQLRRSAAWRAELHAFDYGLELAMNYRISGEERYARRLRYLIALWIGANPPGLGAGWQIQPLARRVRNWILAADLARQDWDRDAIFFDLVAKSLALQTTFLLQHTASVRSADHALDCARALVLAGKFFPGSKAAQLASAGHAIIRHEFASRFPSHNCGVEWRPGSQLRLASAVTEWLVLHASSNEGDEREGNCFEEKLREILTAIEGTLMPDGALPLFGPSPYLAGDELADLFAVAAVLLRDPVCKSLAGKFGVLPYLLMGEAGSADFDALQEIQWKADTCLQPSIGLYRMAMLDSSGIVINGHLPPASENHHDAFSYELFIHGQRVVVDSGVNAPGNDALEQHFSSARAHNVLLVDGAGGRSGAPGPGSPPADMWDPGEGTIGLRIAHQAFGFLGLKSQRAWYCLDAGACVILDRLEGAGNHTAASLIHWYPTFVVDTTGAAGSKDHRAIARSRSLILSVIPLGAPQPRMTVSRGDDPYFQGWYAPEFGVKYASSVLRLEWASFSVPWVGGYLVLPDADSKFEAGETDANAGWISFFLRGKKYRLSVPPALPSEK